MTPRTAHAAGTRTAVYRCYDVNDSLVYIGSSNDPPDRVSAHRARGVPVARWTAEWFDSRDEALTAETEAIAAERPPFNITSVRVEGALLAGPRAVDGRFPFIEESVRRSDDRRPRRVWLTLAEARRLHARTNQAGRRLRRAFEDEVAS